MQNENRFYDADDTLGVLKISGLEAKKMLQGQVTCDLEKITSTNTSMGALCNPQGRIISLFYLGFLDDSYFLVMPRDMVPLTQAALKKFAVFYKVEIIDASNEWKILGLLGNIETADMILKIKLPDPERFLLLGKHKDIAEIKHYLASMGVSISAEEWQQIDIKQKIPAIFPATSGKILPHDIDLPRLDAIAFDKGCYTGQEIIARMHYKAKLKNHLYRAEIMHAKNPQPGMTVSKEARNEMIECGIIITVSQHADKALALIVTDYDSANESLFLSQDIAAKVSLT